MQLDHLSYVAGPEGLGACAQRLGARLGAGFGDGGLHPAFGTRNFVLPLADGCYIEVVAALDHPAAERAPFGRAVAERSLAGGGWLAWVVRVADIADVEQRLGRPAQPGHRRRPDGFDLRWRQIGVNDLAVDPQLPFFVQWEIDDAHHPSAGGSDVTLRRVEIVGEEKVADDYLGVSAARQPFDGVQVDWLSPLRGYTGDESGLVAAVFDTPNGEVRLD